MKRFLFLLFFIPSMLLAGGITGRVPESDPTVSGNYLPSTGGTVTGSVTITGIASATEGHIATASIGTLTVITPIGISLDEIEDLATSKTFTMANKTLEYRFTNPAGGIKWVWQGAATGHFWELMQETGNPGAGTHLAHIQADDSDVLLVHLVHPNAPTPGYFSIDTTDDASSAGDIFWVNSAGETMIGSTTDAGAFKLQIFGDSYLGGNASVTGTLDAGNLTIGGDQVAIALSGDEVLIETATSSYPLPTDGATVAVPVASGAVVMADFWVSLQASPTQLVYTTRMSATWSGYNNTITTVGSETIIFHKWNAGDCSVFIDDYGRVVASVTSNVRAKVTKTEYTTMGGD